MLKLTGQKNISKPRQIRALLVLRGISGAEIARKMSVDRTAIYKVIDGISKSHRLRKAIADALGIRVEELWPEKEAA